MDKDVTKLVEFGNNDHECLPITKCVCGKEYELWDFVIDIAQNGSSKCIYCGREFYFTNNITIYEVAREKSNE